MTDQILDAIRSGGAGLAVVLAFAVVALWKDNRALHREVRAVQAERVEELRTVLAAIAANAGLVEQVERLVESVSRGRRA